MVTNGSRFVTYPKLWITIAFVLTASVSCALFLCTGSVPREEINQFRIHMDDKFNLLHEDVNELQADMKTVLVELRK